MIDHRAADHRFLWHPFTQSDEWFGYEPLVVERARGFHLYDREGRAYVDGVSSLWCNVHGHGHPRIDRAVREQLDRVAHSTLLGLSHVPAIELARRLVEIAPKGLTRVFYSDSGSTAVEVALRMAFQYMRQIGRPERTRFVTLVDGYHGDTLGSVSLGRSLPFHAGYEPITFEALKLEPPFLCPPIDGRGPCDPERLEQAGAVSLGRLERLLAREGRTVAALVVEPLVQGAAGIWPQPISFLRRLRSLCDQHGILLVCDEVATGFGRTGTMFAVEQAGISPDILCLAKGLTGGYLPLAATLATEAVFEAFRGPYEQFRTLFHGHTYGGNPLGCAAALASLDVFAEERTLEASRAHAASLAELLERHVAPLAHVGPIRRVGLMVGFDLLADRTRGERFPVEERRCHRAVLAARAQGVVVRGLSDTMVLMPALAMPPALLETLVATVAGAVRTVTEDGIGSDPRRSVSQTAAVPPQPGSTVGDVIRPETIFVTGTDTGAGKTLVGCAIVAALGARGMRVAVYKPVETGCLREAGGLVGEDCARLAAAAGLPPRDPGIASYRFELPAAPLVAAEAEGTSVDPARLISDFTTLSRGPFDALVVEGAGGLMVPLAEGFTYLDLVRRLGLGVICVVGSRLGCINHALLTLESLRSAGARVAGYVVNCLEPGERALASAKANRATIARFTRVPDLGMFPFVQANRRAEPAHLGRLAESHLALERLFPMQKQSPQRAASGALLAPSEQGLIPNGR